MTINHDTNEGDYNLEITFSDLKRYSRQNFPLCIKLIYDRLKEVHHFKYGSHLQLGNFLKAIGLSLEDSLKFWNYELTHKMTQTHFENNYSYYIKHMYGKVGQKKEYLPDTCAFITSMIIGVNETHGCPFKMWDMLHLTSKLKQLKISQSIIDEITDAVFCKQYQKACSKYFKAVHGVSHDVNINSPLEYFNESRTILKPKVEEYETDSDDESQNENDEL